jgi:hypothetical protein
MQEKPNQDGLRFEQEWKIIRKTIFHVKSLWPGLVVDTRYE